MKMILGKNAIIYNVRFENLPATDMVKESGYKGPKIPSLRIRFIAWLFGLLTGNTQIASCTFDSMQKDGNKGDGINMLQEERK